MTIKGLDAYITGHYGEDQFQGEEPEKGDFDRDDNTPVQPPHHEQVLSVMRDQLRERLMAENGLIGKNINREDMIAYSLLTLAIKTELG